MEWNVLFLIMLGCTLVLLLSGYWIGAGLTTVGIIGLIISGYARNFIVLGNLAWNTSNSYTLTSIPLFVLMGEIILHSGMSRNFYLGVTKVAKHLPGGMLIANIISCAIFSAISGSSVATAAAIGSAAIPEQKRLHYRPRYIAGSLAVGGTLGILIPPSIALIFYGNLTSTSIVTLFKVAMVPGLILAFLYILLNIGIAIIKKQDFADVDISTLADMSWKDAFLGLLPMVVLIGGVLGGIYSGFTTPTEAASVGVVLALILAKIFGEVKWENMKKSLISATKTTAMLVYIMLGAQVISYVWTATGTTSQLVSWMVGLGFSKWGFFVIVCIIYLILGCFVESNSMQYLTLPVLFPVICKYGFDPIWFGVILVILLELGQITPPMGINLFVIQGIDKETPLVEIIKGVLPYIAVMALMIVILCIFPELCFIGA